MKNSVELKKTTIRKVYTQAYKINLERTGKIHCSYCGYHKNENFDKKKYGGYEKKIKLPNWKLLSKNKKQWMKKTIKKTERIGFNGENYISIII